MISLQSRNVNDALPAALIQMKVFGYPEQSRNGPVVCLREPACITYTCPEERVLFWPERDANPFFHFMESLWMLAGRNDLAWPAYFNSKFSGYSDDGYSLNGAYGNRWRNHFQQDQLLNVIELLKKDPTSRRAVIGMWDPKTDGAPYNSSLDLPCNTHIYFRVVEDRLDMTVCNRSNDLIWGACGSNVVHFSMLQELIARSLVLSVGYYHQITNNLHIYKDVPNYELYMGESVRVYSPYTDDKVSPYPMMRVPLMAWMEDLKMFMHDPLNTSGYYDPFFRDVAVPMFKAWEARKHKTGDGMEYTKLIAAKDWQLACAEWIERREAK